MPGTNNQRKRKSRSEERLSLHYRLRGALWHNLRDARRPVGQLRSGIPAAEISGKKIRKCTGLVDVFRRNPNRIAIASCRTIVAPTRTSTVRRSRLVAREPIIRSGTLCGHVNFPDSDLCINAGIARTGIMIVPQHREGHYASSALCDRNRRVRQIVTRNPRIALLVHVSGMRIDHKVRQPCAGRRISVDVQSRV